MGVRLQQACISVGMAAGLMHGYFGYVQPLVLTGIFAPYTQTSKPMFRVHILGGALHRFCLLRRCLLHWLRWLSTVLLLGAFELN